ncbi:translation initiation factor eIF-2A [Viridothelium virens]|uniref:Eukaryotic translation initiation factor 2A n=1 Tax=Viridothelium virens TaxID=1048519 RepID=A0A6A6HIU8_VIRVR|nr:translation initiation factor eIF-2A [Viridothelium virens]
MAEPTQLAYRTLKGIGIFNAAPVYEGLPGFQRPEGNLRCCVYSPDGRFFAWASPEQVSVVDASTGYLVTNLPAENVYELGFSPLGTFIITWQRPSKDGEGNAVKNLKVWRTIDDNAGAGGQRSVVGQFVQKSQTGWNLQYTSDEQYCARCVTNEIQFYQSGDLGTVWNKLRVEGVSDFAVAPGSDHSVAVFIPERKGQPAAVKVYKIPQFDTALSQKTFYKGDKVQFKWNDLGTSVIVLAQTEVDKTNKSYYGETNMYILSASGGFDSRIHLDKEGPIHDVAWSPNSKEFGVVYGYMPAKATIFNAKAVATHDFSLKPRNTILFSPHGRFVLVAGFGNLAGQMDIYDLEKDYNKVCTIEASNASVCEWSPDSRHILTATTSPRLRVDNGVRLWHVGGGIMYNEDMTELYHVCWRPQSPTKHPLENPLDPIPTPHASAIDYLGRVKTPSKPAGAYRPPGARGTTTPLHFKREDEGGAAFVNNGISSTSGGINGFGKPRRREVPGAEAAEPNLPPGASAEGGVSLAGTGEGKDEANLSKAAMKNKKKREAKKAKEAEQKATALVAGEGEAVNGTGNHGVPGRSPERGHSRNRSHGENFRSRNQSQKRGQSEGPDGQRRDQSRRRNQSQRRDQSRKRDDGRATGAKINTRAANQSISDGNGVPANSKIPQGSKPAPGPSAVPAAPDLTVTSPGGGSPEEKRVRALLKKLRAIDDLKMRVAASEKLENTQLQKIQTEDGVRKELAKLGVQE